MYFALVHKRKKGSEVFFFPKPDTPPEKGNFIITAFFSPLRFIIRSVSVSYIQNKLIKLV